MGRTRTQQGITVIESVIGFFILAIVLLGTLQARSFTLQSQARETNRWLAQIALESVVDTIASTSEADLITLINSECTFPGGTCPPPGTPKPIGDPTLFLTSASAPWISNWETPNLISLLKVQIEVFDATTGAKVTTELPTLGDTLDAYDLQITATCQLQRGPTSEALSWTKRIIHP